MLSRQLYINKYLLIDGYNVINAWGDLKKISIRDLEASRMYLIDRLVEYKAYSGDEVIIVFDAYAVKNKKFRKDEHNGVKIVFTKEHQTADSYIEKLATELASDKKNYVRVVTSDWAEQLLILGSGATRVSPRELLIDIKNMKKRIETKYKKNEIIGKSSIAEGLDKSILEALEKLKKEGL